MNAVSILPYFEAPVMALQAAMAQELSLGGATVVTLLGVWLCWGAPRYRMAVEEHVKDGKLTADEAHRKIQRSQWFGPAVTVVGVALLIYSITR